MLDLNTILGQELIAVSNFDSNLQQNEHLCQLVPNDQEQRCFGHFACGIEQATHPFSSCRQLNIDHNFKQWFMELPLPITDNLNHTVEELEAYSTDSHYLLILTSMQDEAYLA